MAQSLKQSINYTYPCNWMDNKFTFKPHIDAIRLRIRLLAETCLVFFNMAFGEEIVEAIFLSVLDYGDVIQRHASTSTLTMLNPQHVSPLIYKCSIYDTPHWILFDQKVGWPSLSIRTNQHLFVFIHKGLLPKLHPFLTSLMFPES